ncbi:hypothetical protein PQU63_19570, partial [Xanthomonas protegens]
MVVFLAVDKVEAMRSPMGEGIAVAVAVAVAGAGAGAGAGALVAVVSAVAVAVVLVLVLVLAFDLPGSLPKRRPARGKTRRAAYMDVRRPR